MYGGGGKPPAGLLPPSLQAVRFCCLISVGAHQMGIFLAWPIHAALVTFLMEPLRHIDKLSPGRGRDRSTIQGQGERAKEWVCVGVL